VPEAVAGCRSLDHTPGERHVERRVGRVRCRGSRRRGGRQSASSAKARR
jgi:hypothetical protein